MRIIKHVKVNNYLNLKNAKLEDLKDLNIIIGPNNCGKTSFLRTISLLSRIDFARVEPSYGCKICEQAFRKITNFLSARCKIDEREKYLAKNEVRVVFGYYASEIQTLLPELSERQHDILTDAKLDHNTRNHLKSEFAKEQLIMIEKPVQNLMSYHVSSIISNEVKRSIFSEILFCPDERLQSYRGKDILEHIKSKNLPATEQSKLIELLKDFVDGNLTDIRYNLDLVRKVSKSRFDTSIEEQGSGIKSLICLVTDILSETQTKMLLIDEPELGLNPSSKHAFLKFLIEQTKGKQIFVATHDPTFVNPILWNRDNVSVYLFSIVNDDFVKVDLAQSKQDPNTFAGYLPHTTSLKKAHIYVEGTYDVYIFQIFLNKYVKRFKDWYRILNEIGIYHLGGDFWSHLLYTIPKRPYSSIVVLDGDKRKTAKQVVSKYTTIEKNRFQIFASLYELRHEKRRRKPIISMPCPVYCLKRSEIEDYLEIRPTSKDEGPLEADKMEIIPDEIEELFDITLELAGIKTMNH